MSARGGRAREPPAPRARRSRGRRRRANHGPAFPGDLVRLGLEQGRDTIAPEIAVRERFKPFVEDELQAWLKPGSVTFTPHPGAAIALPRRAPGQRAALAIGPEGGWVPFEI